MAPAADKSSGETATRTLSTPCGRYAVSGRVIPQLDFQDVVVHASPAFTNSSVFMVMPEEPMAIVQPFFNALQEVCNHIEAEVRIEAVLHA